MQSADSGFDFETRFKFRITPKLSRHPIDKSGFQSKTLGSVRYCYSSTALNLHVVKIAMFTAKPR